MYMYNNSKTNKMDIQWRGSQCPSLYVRFVVCILITKKHNWWSYVSYAEWHLVLEQIHTVINRGRCINTKQCIIIFHLHIWTLSCPLIEHNVPGEGNSQLQIARAEEPIISYLCTAPDCENPCGFASVPSWTSLSSAESIWKRKQYKWDMTIMYTILKYNCF